MVGRCEAADREVSMLSDEQRSDQMVGWTIQGRFRAVRQGRTARNGGRSRVDASRSLSPAISPLLQSGDGEARSRSGAGGMGADAAARSRSEETAGGRAGGAMVSVRVPIGWRRAA